MIHRVVTQDKPRAGGNEGHMNGASGVAQQGESGGDARDRNRGLGHAGVRTDAEGDDPPRPQQRSQGKKVRTLGEHEDRDAKGRRGGQAPARGEGAPHTPGPATRATARATVG